MTFHHLSSPGRWSDLLRGRGWRDSQGWGWGQRGANAHGLRSTQPFMTLGVTVSLRFGTQGTSALTSPGPGVADPGQKLRPCDASFTVLSAVPASVGSSLTSQLSRHLRAPLSSPWRSARAYLRVLIIVSRFHHWEGRLPDPLFQGCPRQCWTPQVPNKEACEEAPFLEVSPSPERAGRFGEALVLTPLLHSLSLLS